MSHLFLIIILIALIFLTMSNSCVHFKPSYNTHLPYANFEAFRTKEGLGGINTGSTVQDPANPDSLFAKMTENPSKKEGFVGLEGALYNTDKPIDIFSGVPGSINCDGISSGLSNSKGGLCLNDKQQNLLRTRGGNSTGGDSQIGV
jgi:hypothetical protein